MRNNKVFQILFYIFIVILWNFIGSYLFLDNQTKCVTVYNYDPLWFLIWVFIGYPVTSIIHTLIFGEKSI